MYRVGEKNEKGNLGVFIGDWVMNQRAGTSDDGDLLDVRMEEKKIKSILRQLLSHKVRAGEGERNQSAS